MKPPNGNHRDKCISLLDIEEPVSDKIQLNLALCDNDKYEGIPGISLQQTPKKGKGTLLKSFVCFRSKATCMLICVIKLTTIA